MRGQWRLAGILGFVCLPLAGYLIAPSATWRWMVAALVVWLHVWSYAGRRLSRHRARRSGPALDRLGPGTGLSLLRGWLLAALSGFLLMEGQSGLRAWLPMAFYTLSDVADYFDGYLARRSRTASQLGEDLDLELDALGMLIAVSLAVRYGKLGLIFLPIALARYAYTLLVALRKRTGRPVYQLPPSLSRRPIAGLTMGFVSATLWPIVDRPEATLLGALIMTAFAASFLRDGAVVSGWLNPSSARYQRARRLARRWLLHWLPLGLRLGLAIFAIGELPRLWNPTAGLLTALADLGFGRPHWTAQVFATLTGLLASLLVLGIAGRFAAFILIFPLGLTVAAAGLDTWRAGGLLLVMALMMVGTGAASLWRPSDRVFRQRAGDGPESAI